MEDERAEGDLYLLEEQRALLALSLSPQYAAQCPWEAQHSITEQLLELVALARNHGRGVHETSHCAHSCLEVEVCGVNELVILEGLEEITWCLDSSREGGFVVHLVAC